jgi:hypothetical protein
MSSERPINLSYLSEQEIIEFYELFFGKILIKKPNFSYFENLAHSLSKENSIKNTLDRLNQNDLQVLKILSTNIFIPYEFIVEKLNVILNIPTTIINKSITNLLLKKYIFLRNEKTLVIPDIYFPHERVKVEYRTGTFEEKTADAKKAKAAKKKDKKPLPKSEYSSKVLIDINNLINYFISKDLKFSNSLSIYKKDATELEDRFSKFSSLKRAEFNVVSYFYFLAFSNEDGSLNLENVKNFYGLSPFAKMNFFLKITFPSMYAILNKFYSSKQNVVIKTEDLKNLWLNSFLLTDFSYLPLKYSVNSLLNLLKSAELIENYGREYCLVKFYHDHYSQVEEELRISSNFNLYINSNTTNHDYYVPSLFANFVKYNKISEYEISEASIRRGVISGFSYVNVQEYFKKHNIKVSANVEKTIKQWFDKHASFFYTTGTILFCEGDEKGKIINTLIKNKMVKAYEVKKNEVFLIPDEDKTAFFAFLEKSGINYYKKEYVRNSSIRESKLPDLTEFM